MNTAFEFLIIRDTFRAEAGSMEGFTLGKIFAEGLYIGETLEDQDRGLEKGGVKVPGKTGMPCGRYMLTLYQSPKHGLVPKFENVPQFSYTEIHGANHANELLGCVAVGRVRTADGVAKCSDVVKRIVDLMEVAIEEGKTCWCTITRAGE